MKTLLPVLLVFILAMPASALQNQLKNHPSPYLAMHGDDPVAWQDWGEEALSRARAEGRLLFISSGYFACHWCHVMQRESYKNPQIAAVLNEFFIPVKLDRELHGALDSYLIKFVELTQGRAGWPLNVFLTPQGYPLIGTTYLPAKRFQALLEKLQMIWQQDPDKTGNLARSALLALTARQDGAAKVAPLTSAELRKALVRSVLAKADPMEGGFGGQSRFPMTSQLLAILQLLEQQSTAGQPPTGALAEFILLTLEKIRDEGMRDQLGGGFYRYTVDPSWQVPHYEKMLYTQAQLAEVYLQAGQLFQRADLVRVARDTLDFVLRDMRGEQGGYIASFSAVDGAGEEGAVYLWTIEELHRVLAEEDVALARRYWRMRDVPSGDLGYLPRRGDDIDEIARDLDKPVDVVRARVQAVRQKLLSARKLRDLPADTKELAGWNGLMLAALSRAAMDLKEPAYRAAAAGLKDFLHQRLWDGQRLLRARSAAGGIGRASLADYAYMAYGMQKYAQLTREPADSAFAGQLLDVAWQRFYDTTGWYLTDQALIPGLGAELAMSDGGLPAPPPYIIALSLQSDKPLLREKALAALGRSRLKVQQRPFWHASHVMTLLKGDAPDRSGR